MFIAIASMPSFGSFGARMAVAVAPFPPGFKCPNANFAVIGERGSGPGMGFASAARISRAFAHMDFKFAVGKSVSYRPVGQRPALFTIMRQMPEDHGLLPPLGIGSKRSRGIRAHCAESDLLKLGENGASEAERVFRKV